MKKNKILSLLFSFLVAMGLWLFVVTNISTKDDTALNNIPVSLLNQEDLKSRGLILVSGGNTSVSLKLYGDRGDLWKLNRENVSVTADLGPIMEAGTYDLNFVVNFPDGISAMVQDRNPKRVTVEIADYAEKNVQVQLNYTGEMAEGLLLDKENAVLDYNAITVAGPKEIVEQIANATIEIDRSKLTETLNASYRYTLTNAKGEPVDASLITTNVAEVNLRLPVEHYKEIKLRVNLIAGGGATPKSTTVNISPETIMISGSEEALTAMQELVLGEIDLSTVEGPKLLDYPLNLPDNVTNRSGLTSAQVAIAFKDLATKTFTITKFQATNIPEGLEATVMTKQVEIVIRGPRESIAAVTLADIVATADYKDQDAGTVTVPLTISVKDHSDVGAIGKYNISVTLAPPEETKPGA